MTPTVGGVRHVLRLARALLGAVVVGVATLLQPKPEPERHWSVPPTFPVEDEHGGAEAGGPPRR